MSALAVIVANVIDDAGSIDGSLDALRRELLPSDELMFVDAADVPERPGVTWIRAASPARGVLYAVGLAAARSPFVAFTDSATEVLPGWRDAAMKALSAGATVVGGPVLPPSPATPVSAAGFIVEYGPHASPPFSSASGDVAANNVAYRRAALEEVLAPGDDVWKTTVDASLHRRGERPTVAAGMRVLSTKSYGWHDILGRRLDHGRLYGAQRAATWSVAHRVAAAVGCAALPVLSYCRLARRIQRAPALRRMAIRVAPLILLSLVCWSAGEAQGYLLGPGQSQRAVF